MIGCLDRVTEFVQEQLLIVAAIGIAFVVGEVRGRGREGERGREGGREGGGGGRERERERERELT